MQNLVVSVLVAGCFVYALWTLGPKAARKRLAVALLDWKLPLPEVLKRPLAAAASPGGGCGCNGCDRSQAKNPASAGPKPVLIVRKRQG